MSGHGRKEALAPKHTFWVFLHQHVGTQVYFHSSEKSSPLLYSKVVLWLILWPTVTRFSHVLQLLESVKRQVPSHLIRSQKEILLQEVSHSCRTTTITVVACAQRREIEENRCFSILRLLHVMHHRRDNQPSLYVLQPTSQDFCGLSQGFFGELRRAIVANPGHLMSLGKSWGYWGIPRTLMMQFW